MLVLILTGLTLLIAQQEIIAETKINLFLAGVNAENGLNYLRAKWFNAELKALKWTETSEEYLTTGFDAIGTMNGIQLKAIRQMDNTWLFSSTGSYAYAKRRYEAIMPAFTRETKPVVFINRGLSGAGLLKINDIPAEQSIFHYNEAVHFGVGIVGEYSTHTSEYIIGLPYLGDIKFLAGNYIQGQDGLPLEINTLQGEWQRWGETDEIYETIACEGTLIIGSEPNQNLYINNVTRVFLAREIIINGVFVFDEESEAEIWLLATEGITWTSKGEADQFVRGMIWTPGLLKMNGVSHASWIIEGAVIANDLYLQNSVVYMTAKSNNKLPDIYQPHRHSIPELKQLQILAIGN